MMFVYRSNRIEQLVEALSELLDTPAGSPLEPEHIVVENRSMAVWVSLRLAERQGVWANCQFPYPHAFIRHVMSAVLGNVAEGNEAFERDRLVWALLTILPEHLERQEFARLRRYLAEDHVQLKRFQLAQRVAETFSAYPVYRPEMVRQWEEGQDGRLKGSEHAWQPILWRALVTKLGRRHTASLAHAFLRVLEDTPKELANLPKRVSLFGVGNLPPLYIELMQALARHLDVHVFQLAPTPYAWRQDDADERGNPLLASLAIAGAVTHHLHEVLDHPTPRPELYEPPKAESVLGMVQSDIFHLRQRGRRSDDTPRYQMTTGDHSIRVHACHSPLREVEVLHDQLLDLLAQDTGLSPEDIVVLTPDLDTYAPLIDAVFQRHPTDAHNIPYRMVGRSRRREGLVIEAFHRILGLVQARLTASQVLGVLALEPVREHFGITAEDLVLIANWVTDCGIRWGFDKRHRRDHGQPEFHENTWRFGLDRLLLGYAMPGEGRELFTEVLPYDEIEGQEAALLGKLAEFCERLYGHLEQLQSPRALGQWGEALSHLLEGMLARTSHTAWQHQAIRSTLHELVERAESAGFAEPVGLEVIQPLLQQSLDAESTSSNVLTAGVAFCPMLSMRSLPFKVVCLLGMNDGVFPRANRPHGFDLIAMDPRTGDRFPHTDDRYLFLEALLAARQRLLLTCVGQSSKDNRAIPPSVVVSELVDYLTTACNPPIAPACDREATDEAREAKRVAAVCEQLVVRHPLQPFSPRYFDPAEPRLFSYADGHRQGAQALISEPLQIPSLFVEPLAALDQPEGQRQLTLGELAQFFQQPTAYLLKRRLGVYLDKDKTVIKDREPVELGDLERYQIGARLLDLELAGVSSERSWRLLRASGCLPLGTPGKYAHQAMAKQAISVAETIRAYQTNHPLPNLSVDLSVADTRITGALTGICPEHLLQYQYARIQAGYILAAWVRHLVLCLCASPGYPRETILVGRQPESGAGVVVSRFTTVEETKARQILQDLVALYWLGQCEPLLLFPKSGMAYVQKLLHMRERDAESARQQALEKARQVWEHDRYAESSDVYLQKVFGGRDPLQEGFSLYHARPMAGGSFMDLSTRVFVPLLEYVRTVG